MCVPLWDTVRPGHKLVITVPPPNGARPLAAWWRHQMETFSALLAICAGNSPVPGEFPHKGQWRGALMFSWICVWINDWVNNRETGDLRRYRAHYDVTVMDWKARHVILWVPHDVVQNGRRDLTLYCGKNISIDNLRKCGSSRYCVDFYCYCSRNLCRIHEILMKFKCTKYVIDGLCELR